MNYCLNIQLHLPKKLANYTMFDVGEHSNYFDENHHKHLFENSIDKFEKFLEKSDFKFNISISGIMMELIEKYKPELITQIKHLVEDDKVELICETYHHSHAFIYSKDEFKEQVNLHKNKLVELFNYYPTSFKNTDFMYNDEVSEIVSEMGFKTVLADGNGFNPNKLYKDKDGKVNILLKDKEASNEPSLERSGEIVNLFINYKDLNVNNLKLKERNYFKASELKGKEPLSVTHHENGWGNLHKHGFDKIYELEHKIKSEASEELLNTWRYLTCSDLTEDDHYENYIKFRNILKDLTYKV